MRRTLLAAAATAAVAAAFVPASAGAGEADTAALVATAHAHVTADAQRTIARLAADGIPIVAHDAELLDVRAYASWGRATLHADVREVYDYAPGGGRPDYWGQRLPMRFSFVADGRGGWTLTGAECVGKCA